MMSGCSQGSHIFEVVFIRDRRQPTFTIVADVNGSFFLFSQCPCHCYSFACDELSQVGDAFREAFLANSILRTARERRKRKNAAFAAGASSPLRLLPSALALVCCVADYPRSLKKNAASATQATLIANGASFYYPWSHMTQKRGKIRHAMLRVTEETQKKNQDSYLVILLSIGLSSHSFLMYQKGEIRCVLKTAKR